MEYNSQEYLTVSEVKELLRVSRMTVHRMLGRGDLPGSFKVGGGSTSNWRIPRSAIETFKVQHCSKVTV